MDRSAEQDERRCGCSLFGAFGVCILTGMVAGLLGEAGILGKTLSENIFIVCWIVGIDLMHVKMIIEGEVHWLAGPLLVSRAKTPVRYWCHILFSIAFFNGLGLLFLFRK